MEINETASQQTTAPAQYRLCQKAQASGINFHSPVVQDAAKFPAAISHVKFGLATNDYQPRFYGKVVSKPAAPAFGLWNVKRET